MLRKCCSDTAPCSETGKRTSSSPDTPLRIRTLTDSGGPSAARAQGVGGVKSGLHNAPPRKGEGTALGVTDWGMEGAQLAAIEKSSQDVE
mmetsp:Transcript_11410/g.35737  ORF Transcript_11410/g.35737 Transcript_11410/m.35737 type:complete len:90 (-) Transcript_11410:121-390(-)